MLEEENDDNNLIQPENIFTLYLIEEFTIVISNKSDISIVSKFSQLKPIFPSNIKKIKFYKEFSNINQRLSVPNISNNQKINKNINIPRIQTNIIYIYHKTQINCTFNNDINALEYFFIITGIQIVNPINFHKEIFEPKIIHILFSSIHSSTSEYMETALFPCLHVGFCYMLDIINYIPSKDHSGPKFIFFNTFINSFFKNEKKLNLYLFTLQKKPIHSIQFKCKNANDEKFPKFLSMFSIDVSNTFFDSLMNYFSSKLTNNSLVPFYSFKKFVSSSLIVKIHISNVEQRENQANICLQVSIISFGDFFPIDSKDILSPFQKDLIWVYIKDSYLENYTSGSILHFPLDVGSIIKLNGVIVYDSPRKSYIYVKSFSNVQLISHL